MADKTTSVGRRGASAVRECVAAFSFLAPSFSGERVETNYRICFRISGLGGREGEEMNKKEKKSAHIWPGTR